MRKSTKIKLASTIIYLLLCVIFVSFFYSLQYAVQREVISGHDISEIDHFLLSLKETPFASYTYIISIVLLIVSIIWLVKLLLSKEK